MSLSLQVRSDNGAGVALAGTADAPMLDPLRDPLRAALAVGHDATIARLAEARIYHVVAVHRSVADALGDDHDEVVS